MQLKSFQKIDLIDIDSAKLAVVELHKQLINLNFTKLEHYPWPGSFSSLYDDPGIFFRFLLKKSNSWRPSFFWKLYAYWLKKFNSELDIFARAFIWCEPVSNKELRARFGSAKYDYLLENKILIEDNNQCLSRVRATLFSDGILWSDGPPLLRENFVFLGADSLTFVRHLKEILEKESNSVNNALDICTGSGVHAFLLTKYAKSVIGADINSRAIRFAKLNLDLKNNLNKVEFFTSDLISNIPKKTYDLVVSNTPFLFLPDTLRSKCIDGDGGKMGIELVMRLIKLLPSIVSRNGKAILHANSPIVGKKDLLEEALRDQLNKGPWKIILKPTHAYYNPDFDELYKKNGINKFITYVICLYRSEKPELIKESFPLIRDIACKIRIAMQRK